MHSGPLVERRDASSRPGDVESRDSSRLQAQQARGHSFGQLRRAFLRLLPRCVDLDEELQPALPCLAISWARACTRSWADLMSCGWHPGRSTASRALLDCRGRSGAASMPGKRWRKKAGHLRAGLLHAVLRHRPGAQPPGRAGMSSRRRTSCVTATRWTEAGARAWQLGPRRRCAAGRRRGGLGRIEGVGQRFRYALPLLLSGASKHPIIGTHSQHPF